MKILFDHDVFTYQTFGGIARCFSELIGQMEKLQPACCRLGFKFTNALYLYDLGLAERFGLCHYPFGNRLWAKQLFFRINRFLFYRTVRKNDFDLLHLTFYPAPEIREMTSKPIAVTVHDMTPEIYPELFPGAGKWIAAKKFWCHHADMIFTDSDCTRMDLLRIFPDIPPEKVHRVYISGGFSPELHSELEVPESYLLYVGGRQDYKNFLPMLSALIPVFQEYENLHLICAGGGSFTGGEKQLIQKAGLTERIIQKNLSEAALAQLYEQAAALIYPSLYEGFGIPILEAFSRGLPVLLSDRSCFPEIAGNAALYFDPENADSIAGAVRRILAEPELRQELVRRGNLRLKDFSWEKSAHELLGIYRQYI
ncbi:MAG: glycosyltransferase family 4 protein [Lentisphaeria bacterium]|nr:glycosyltransferase family 4 protein [Lentisphaeria bacterium]